MKLACSVLALCWVVAACAARGPEVAPPVASPADVRRSFATSADGVRLAIDEAGPRDAPAIVFIHGLGFSREVWQRQLAGPLAARFHLVAYDLRGHGKSSAPTLAAAYAEGAGWAADLEAVLAATRARSPLVVAWSLGGLVVAHYLRVHGDRALGGVVFVDAVTKFAPELFVPGNARYMAGLSDPRDDIRAAATRAFVRACFAQPPPELAALERAAGVLPAATHAAIQRISTDGTEAALRSLRRPALVIHGAREAFVADAMAEHTRALIPGAPLVRFAASGHAPFIDETARFDAELARFAAGAAR